MIEDQGRETPARFMNEKKDGIVLDITRERLSHLYGDHENLTVQLSQEGGTLVKIRIPFKEMIVESEGAFIVEKCFVKIRTLIVDDEPHAREGHQNSLKGIQKFTYCG